MQLNSFQIMIMLKEVIAFLFISRPNLKNLKYKTLIEF